MAEAVDLLALAALVDWFWFRLLFFVFFFFFLLRGGTRVDGVLARPRRRRDVTETRVDDVAATETLARLCSRAVRALTRPRRRRRGDAVS